MPRTTKRETAKAKAKAKARSKSRSKSKSKPKTIGDAVREVCLWLPESEEYLSHGSPNFRVQKGRTYAVYVVNHHGDGRIALWLNSPAGAQEHHVRENPRCFFVPPYVGPRGWLGVHLDKGLSWERIAALVREAYEQVAPSRLFGRIGKTIDIEPPRATVAETEFDPMRSARAQKVLAGFRKVCSSWPEITEATQFGAPVWRAGQKTFATAYAMNEGLLLSFWVGIDRQGLLVSDPRFTIPKYMGHNGWISLDVTRNCDWAEVRALALESYRHFALKRMLAAMPDAADR